MSQQLIPCSSCARHVQPGASCPFCDAPVDAREAPTTVNARLLRAAMIGLGAAVALTTSCAVSPPYGVPPIDANFPDRVASDQQSPADSSDANDNSDASSD